MVDHRDFDDDEKPDPKAGMLYEFECPDCNAHNPYPDGFAMGGEVLCYYCGVTFKVVPLGEKRFKLKEA